MQHEQREHNVEKKKKILFDVDRWRAEGAREALMWVQPEKHYRSIKRWRPVGYLSKKVKTFPLYIEGSSMEKNTAGRLSGSRT